MIKQPCLQSLQWRGACACAPSLFLVLHLYFNLLSHSLTHSHLCQHGRCLYPHFQYTSDRVGGMRQKRKAPSASPPSTSSTNPSANMFTVKLAQTQAAQHPSAGKGDSAKGPKIGMTIGTSDSSKQVTHAKETSPKCCPSPSKRKALPGHRLLNSAPLSGPPLFDTNTPAEKSAGAFPTNLTCDTNAVVQKHLQLQSQYRSESIAEKEDAVMDKVNTGTDNVEAASGPTTAWESFLSLATVAAGLSESKDYEHPHRPVTPPIYAASCGESQLNLGSSTTRTSSLATSGSGTEKRLRAKRAVEDYACSPMASRLSSDFSAKLHCSIGTQSKSSITTTTQHSPIRSSRRASLKGGAGKSAAAATGAEKEKGTATEKTIGKSMEEATAERPLTRDSDIFKNLNLLEQAVEQFTKSQYNADLDIPSDEKSNPSSCSAWESDGYYPHPSFSHSMCVLLVGSLGVTYIRAHPFRLTFFSLHPT